MKRKELNEDNTWMFHKCIKKVNKIVIWEKGGTEMEDNWCIICREYVDECICDEEEEEN